MSCDKEFDGACLTGAEDCPGRRMRGYCLLVRKNIAPALPPLWKQAANFVASAIKHVAAGMPEASPAAAAARLEVCQACPQYLADSGRCAACGCYLAAKTTWQLQSCPEGKW